MDGVMRERGRQRLLLLLTSGVLLIGCGDKVAPGSAQVKRQLIRGVSVETVVPRQIDELYEASGTVRAVHTSVIASRTMGTVTSLLVREGDRVEAGQVLLTIDDRDVVQKVKAAEAGNREAARALDSARQNRELAEITSQRYQKMYDEKAISRQEMDQFAAQRQVAASEYERVQEMGNRAVAGLAEAKVMMGFTRITSPLKGTVTEKKTEVGSMAVPGMPLLTVESTAGFTAEVSIDEGLAGKIKVGSPATVAIDSLNRRLSGKVTQILPAVDPLSRTFTAKVSVSGPGLRSGLYAKVTIPRGKKEAILAPRTALVDKGQLTGVYAVDGRGIVTYRLVRIGRSYDDRLEILSGLAANDRIIVQGTEKAVDGGIIEGSKP